jgi:asparagine synthase (glutamine-hydrolysing)
MLNAVLMPVSDRRIKKLRNYLSKSMQEVLLYNCATLDLEQARNFINSDTGQLFPYRNDFMSRTTGKSALQRVTLQDQHTYLVSILNRQDKMSMAASIESRVPLLDYRIVEFANSLPDGFKQKGTQTKLILKKLAEDYLPHDVVYRRKSGFGIPLPDWFREAKGLGELANDTLNSVNLDELENLVNVEDSLKAHNEEKADHSELLWSVLNYALWKKNYGIT